MSTPPIPEIEAACLAAEAAFDVYRDEVMVIGPALIATTSRESGLQRIPLGPVAVIG